MDQFADRTVFVTGGAKGIGLGIARAFAREGAKLALVDLDEQALRDAERELSRLTAVEVRTLDVRDRPLFAEVADSVEARLGPVSVLCNNAGVAGSFSLEQMNYDLWDLVIGTNLGGFINGVQTFLPRMLRRGEPGHLFFTSAGSGLATGGYTGYMYETSKYGVMGLGESLRQQLKNGGHNIGVTILCPGPVPANAPDTLRAALERLPPASSPDSSPEGRVKAEARAAAWKAVIDQGVPPDEVGEMVVEGIRANRLFVHTDRTMWDGVWARAKAILAAMPARATPSVTELPKLDRNSSS